MYVGRDRSTLEVLQRLCDDGIYQLETCPDSFVARFVAGPSWRCDRLIFLDHFEEFESNRFLEQLTRHDAGIPVMAILDGENPARLTYAGLARMHGADTIAVKPIVDLAALRAAVDLAFRKLEHWRAHFRHTCVLENFWPAPSRHEPAYASPATPMNAEAVAVEAHGAAAMARS
jgi:hypothetical protein